MLFRSADEEAEAREAGNANGSFITNTCTQPITVRVESANTNNHDEDERGASVKLSEILESQMQLIHGGSEARPFEPGWLMF